MNHFLLKEFVLILLKSVKRNDKKSYKSFHRKEQKVA